MSERTHTAVLDRFEEGVAVLLLETDGGTADELLVPSELLPPEGRHPDAVFAISVLDDERTEVRYDSTETARRTEDARSRFDRLSEPLSAKDDERR